MKKNLIIAMFVIFSLAFSFSCSSKKALNISDYSSMQIDPNKTLQITWGYLARGNSIEAVNRVKNILNDRFKVELDWVAYTPPKTQEWPSLIFKDAQGSNLPDIVFEIPLYEVAQMGAIRTIPRHMIEIYAPNYANLLYQEEAWQPFEANRRGFEGAFDDHQAFLAPYSVESDMVNYFSVYRLDCLEAIGLYPKGELVKIDPNKPIYFTDVPFTQEDFVEIISTDIKKISDLGINHNIVLTGDYFMDRDIKYGVGSPLSIWGMFGIGYNYVFENGRIIPVFASEGYKEFLLFLEQLVHKGHVTVTERYDWPKSYFILSGQYGSIWVTMHINDLLIDISHFDTLFRNNPSAKILITPPETNANGTPSVTRANGGSRFIDGLYNKWAISSLVSNEKLARILTVFDAISFEPDLFVLTQYGLEESNYTWAGEPYNSKVVKGKTSNRYWPVVESKVWDGNAGNYVYLYGDNPLYNYAVSDAARATLQDQPLQIVDYVTYFSEMVFYWDEFNCISNSEFGKTVTEYYRDILEGREYVDNSWHDYIHKLEVYGLDAVIDIANRTMRVK